MSRYQQKLAASEAELGSSPHIICSTAGHDTSDMLVNYVTEDSQLLCLFCTPLQCIGWIQACFEHVSAALDASSCLFALQRTRLHCYKALPCTLPGAGLLWTIIGALECAAKWPAQRQTSRWVISPATPLLAAA